MLNEKIKMLRLSYGISQVELAKQLNVTKQCVSNWENDNVQPSVDMLIKIAEYFNVSTDFLLDIDHGEYVSVAGLSPKEVAHIKFIIQDLQTGK